MPSNPSVEIPLSKTKIILMILGSILFVAGSYFSMKVYADIQTKYDPMFFKGVAIFCMVIFTYAGIAALIKLFDSKLGLTINREGLIDNTTGASVGLIKWADITEIKTGEIKSNKFLVIKVKDPEGYIAKGKSFFKRRLLQMNYIQYGGPIHIGSGTLKCKFSELEKLIREAFEESRSMSKNANSLESDNL